MYRVLVDDNFHYQDENERWEAGAFVTAEEAIATCRALVDRDLAGNFKAGMTAEALYGAYVGFCNDPFIVADAGEPRCSFSAWNYAKQRAQEMCSVVSHGNAKG